MFLPLSQRKRLSKNKAKIEWSMHHHLPACRHGPSFLGTTFLLGTLPLPPQSLVPSKVKAPYSPLPLLCSLNAAAWAFQSLLLSASLSSSWGDGAGGKGEKDGIAAN